MSTEKTIKCPYCGVIAWINNGFYLCPNGCLWLKTYKDYSTEIVVKEKPQLSYLLQFRNALRGTASILSYGDKKYDKKPKWKELTEKEHLDALLRHVLEYDKIDPETGKPQIYNVICRALMIAEKMNENTET